MIRAATAVPLRLKKDAAMIGPDPDITSMTLARLREQRPCVRGWLALLEGLDGARTPMTATVNLGDIARICGADDAWWSARVFDLDNRAIRRALVAALLPAARRVAREADRNLLDNISKLARWVDGDDSVDLARASFEAAVTDEHDAVVAHAIIAVATAAHGHNPDLAVRAYKAIIWKGSDASDRAAADLIAAFPPLYTRVAA